VARLLPALLLLAACTPAEFDPVLSDAVDLTLWTILCEPEEDPETHFYVDGGAPYTIRWDARCIRDGGEIAWWAVKVSYWEDRAEDAWNLWLIDPDVDEVSYGDARVDGTTDPNIPNPSFPNALERVAPAPLTAGDYRVEIWGIVGEYTDSMRNEVRVTVVE
jgi:hypothetical protein